LKDAAAELGYSKWVPMSRVKDLISLVYDILLITLTKVSSLNQNDIFNEHPVSALWTALLG